MKHYNDLAGILLVAWLCGCSGGEPDPEAFPDTISYSIAEDTLLEVSAAEGLYPDAENVRLEGLTEPGNGLLTLAEDGAFSYQPAPDFFGEDQFELVLSYESKGQVVTLERVVVLNIEPVNDAPWVGSVVGVGRPAQIVSLSLLASSFDVEEEALEVSALGQAANGTVTLSGDIASYTSNVGFEGTDHFSFTSVDASGAATESTATVIVQAEFAGASEVTLLSKSLGGVEANRDIVEAVVSGNGRYVAFRSAANNLGPTSSGMQVFLLDRASGEVRLVSKSSAGVSGNAASNSVSISADGNYVVFTSEATNLIDVDFNSHQDVFLYERLSDSVIKISNSPDGGPSDGRSEPGATISADGSTVLFLSDATNLVAGESPGTYRNAFFYSTATRMLQRSTAAGDPNAVVGPSADGRFFGQRVWDGSAYRFSLHDRRTSVSHLLSSSKAVELSPDGQRYARLRNLEIRTGTFLPTTEVRVGYAGDSISELDGNIEELSMAADGSIAFSTWATNLVVDDSNIIRDIYVTQPSLALTSQRVTLNSAGEQANNSSSHPELSLDGKWITFLSTATNLGGGHTGQQLYVVASPLASP